MNPRPTPTRVPFFVAAFLALSGAAATAPAPTYSENFDRLDPGNPPKEILAPPGTFRIAADDAGNKVLELPGDPLDLFGALFGPAEQNLIDVRARVWGAATGKRFPEFGVGAADLGGYKLLLLPRQRRLVLRKSDVEVAGVPYDAWKTETWTAFRLTIEPAAGAWRITGSAWPAGADESKAVTLIFEEKQKPASGRASVWGVPFSGKPIRFDDVEVRVGK
jgi:hypothetical protein